MKQGKKKLVSVLALALLLAMCFALPALADTVGNEQFQTNLELYPGLYDAEAGVTAPVFKPAEAITEDIWIEVPVDTDNDGKRDLVRARVARPKGSGENGFKVPVILEYSPYRNGRSVDDTPFIQNVFVEQSLVGENGVLDKSAWTYADVETTQLRAADWPWSDEAYEDGSVSIPASRGERPLAAKGNDVTSIVSTSAGFYNYMFTRGYAVVYSSCVGNNYTARSDVAGGDYCNEGLNSCGNVEETLSGEAVVQWLNGNCRAYTDKAATQEVKATDWCSGLVCMTGQSYVATLPMMVAATGVEGLECIIPRAGIVNWYDYFHGNGGTIAGQDAQGEDSAWLTWYCNGRYLGQPGAGAQELFEENMDQMLIDCDRVTGDYNEFWDLRNSLATIDKWHAAVIFQEGFNDRNVGAEHMDQLYRALKKKDPNYPIKLVLHLKGHTTIWDQNDGLVLEWSHKWLDHFLYGIDNGIEGGDQVMIVDNLTGEWNTYEEWPVEGSEYQRYYLSTAYEGHGQLVEEAPEEFTEEAIYDQLKYRTLEEFCADESDPYYITNLEPWSELAARARNTLLNEYNTRTSDQMGSNGREISDANWYDFQTLIAETFEMNLLNYDWDEHAPDLEAENPARLVYITDPLEYDVTLSGTPKITLNITPDKGKGSLTAAIVDIGPEIRGNAGHYTAVNASSIPADTETGLRAYQMKNYQVSTSAAATPYKFVTRGSVDIQNPNPTGETYIESTADTAFMPPYYWQTTKINPGQAYSYTFTLEPRHYTFQEGNRLAVIVYTTDYRHTIMPKEVTKVEVNLGEGSYIDLPLVGDDPLYTRTDISDFTVNDWIDMYDVEDKTVTVDPTAFSVTPAGGGDELILGRDYVVELKNNPDGVYSGRGRDTAVFRGIGDYEGEIEMTFTYITKTGNGGSGSGGNDGGNDGGDDTPSIHFNDVEPGRWSEDDIYYVAERGLFQGVAPNVFGCEQNTTRGMLMTVLARMDGVNTNGGDPWYQKGMDWAVANGVSDGTNPEALITREQLVTMLYRYAGKPAVSGSLSAFSDASEVSPWAYDAMVWAVDKGIIVGYNNKLTPKANATREQVAAIMARFDKLMK